MRILSDLDRCSRPGEIGAVMRREGLYSGTISRWRQQRDTGAFHGLSPTKRGPKVTRAQAPGPNPLVKDVARLERENADLKRRLLQAETIIDVQKKVSQLLGIPLSDADSDEKS
ncbi:MAG: helix-turn-helix domain-containing protein [bacterium]|nr:helix-turn-helix domain-containing protein [bacterium]